MLITLAVLSFTANFPDGTDRKQHAHTNGNTLTVDGSGVANLTGKVTGHGSRTPGTFNLNPTFFISNDYNGLTTNAGPTINNSRRSGERPGQGTVVRGATLQSSGIITVAEPLTLNGFGIGGDVPGNLNGALATGGFTTWTGPISLVSDAAIGNVFTGNFTVNTNPVALNGHTLVFNTAGTATFNTAIVDGIGGGGSLVVNRGLSTGTMNLAAANTYSGSTALLAGMLSLSGNGTLASTDSQVFAT